MYLTPEIDISNLNLSISKQHNVDIAMFPENFPEIPRGKQMKITLEVEIKNVPYAIPSMFVNFTKGREQKSYNIHIPWPLYKFLEFHPINDRQ